MQKPKGFTLIELLVVIAIIALLMAILMPALAKVRKQAKDVIGMKACREWAVVGNMYTTDHEGYFDTGGGMDYEKWANSWRRYYKDHDLLVCPTATKFWFENPTKSGAMQTKTPDNDPETPFSAWGKYADELDEYTPDQRRWDYTGIYGSFGSNSWTYDYPANIDEENKYWRTINVKGADRIPMIADCLHIGGKPQITDDFGFWNGYWDYASGGSAKNALRRFMMDRHGGGIHVALFDFSVRKVGVKPVAWWLKWHRGYDGGNAFSRQFDNNPENWNWMDRYRYEDY